MSIDSGFASISPMKGEGTSKSPVFDLIKMVNIDETSSFLYNKRKHWNANEMEAAKWTDKCVKLYSRILGEKFVIHGTAEEIKEIVERIRDERPVFATQLGKVIDYDGKKKLCYFVTHDLDKDHESGKVNHFARAHKNNCSRSDCLSHNRGACDSFGINQACKVVHTATTRGKLASNSCTTIPPCPRLHYGRLCNTDVEGVAHSEPRYVFIDFLGAWETAQTGKTTSRDFTYKLDPIVKLMRGGPEGEALKVFEQQIISSKNASTVRRAVEEAEKEVELVCLERQVRLYATVAILEDQSMCASRTRSLTLDQAREMLKLTDDITKAYNNTRIKIEAATQRLQEVRLAAAKYANSSSHEKPRNRGVKRQRDSNVDNEGDDAPGDTTMTVTGGNVTMLPDGDAGAQQDGDEILEVLHAADLISVTKGQYFEATDVEIGWKSDDLQWSLIQQLKEAAPGVDLNRLRNPTAVRTVTMLYLQQRLPELLTAAGQIDRPQHTIERLRGMLRESVTEETVANLPIKDADIRAATRYIDQRGWWTCTTADITAVRRTKDTCDTTTLVMAEAVVLLWRKEMEKGTREIMGCQEQEK